jgi:hypothetical protein
MSDPFSTPKHRLDIAGQHVFLAMPAHQNMHPNTVVSLLKTQREFHERGVPLDVAVIYGNSLVHHARSKIAWDFLQTKATRLFWVDSDMEWEPKDFVRLVALTSVMDMVAGAYSAKQDPPLVMVKNVNDLHSNRYGCITLDGLGMGFTCMTREVVEALAENAPRVSFNGTDELIPHIFHYDGRGAGGEDMAFFADAKALGYQLWVDPSITLGHIGPKVYRASLKDYLQRVKEPA